MFPRVRVLCVLLLAAGPLSGSCAPKRGPAAAIAPDARFELAGQFSIPPQTVFPPGGTLPFGGLSGLAALDAPGEFLVVADERTDSRMYRIRLEGQGGTFRATPQELIPLETGPVGPRLDPEGIVIARGGRVLISSEGIGSEQPRVAPAIVEYTQAGRFVRQLAVPEKFIPNPTGALIRGVRDNFGLEALTLSPSGRRLFTAGETSLVQDGEPVTFDRGATARLIEYVESGDTFTPGREFPYPLAAIDKVPFEASLSVMGVVELLALSDTEMLALERTFVEQTGTPGRGVNRARIYRVSIDGATDVSSVGSLRNAAFTPVKKTLLLDLSTVQGLSPDLANLDNFEGLAFGHGRANGPRVLVVISDDNLNPTQRSWFLLLRLL